MTELFYSDAPLDAIRRQNVERCLALVALGHCDAALRQMGFADGCIRDARAEAARAASGPLPMTRPGGVIHD